MWEPVRHESNIIVPTTSQNRLDMNTLETPQAKQNGGTQAHKTP
jgi:hypothetical protein